MFVFHGICVGLWKLNNVNKLSDSEIQIVDKVLAYLYPLNSPDCSCEYNVLKIHIIELQNTETKKRIDAILSANDLCTFIGFSQTAYKLTANGKKIILEHSSYRVYIKAIEDKEKRESEMYENSKTNVRITKKSLNWGIISAAAAIISAIVAILIMCKG